MNRQIHRFGAWVGAVLACVLAACSGGSGSSSADATLAPVNPCSVLAAGDIQSALGVSAAGDSKRDNMGVTDSCSWSLSNGADLDVTFYNPANSAAAALFTPSVSSRTPDDKSYEAVSGLGDQAVFRENSRPPIITASEVVEVVKGKRHFDVHYVVAATKASPASKDAMVSLARTVLAHAN